MPKALSPVNLATATVGTTGSIDITTASGPGGVSYAMPGQPVLRLHNESPCGLMCSFPTSGQSFNIPAGGWQDCYPEPGDNALNFTVLYIISNAQVNLLLSTYYYPGDYIPPLTALGNSPIGGTVTSTTATNIVNTGNALGSPVVVATNSLNTTDPLTNLMNNGSLILGGTTIADPSGELQINLQTVLGSVNPPTGTGSVLVYQIAGAATPYTTTAGTFYKRLLLVFNNLKNTSVSKYTLALPAAMHGVSGWFIQTADSPAIEFLNSGTAQGMNIVSAIGSLSTGVTSIGMATWGSGLGVFDTLRFGASDATTHNGFAILEYI